MCALLALFRAKWCQSLCVVLCEKYFRSMGVGSVKVGFGFFFEGQDRMRNPTISLKSPHFFPCSLLLTG